MTPFLCYTAPPEGGAIAMPTVPATLLRRLYVPGSLRNVETGFVLSLKNLIAPGTIVSVGPVVVDGMTWGPDRITVTGKGQPRPAERISAKSPLPFPINQVVTVQVTAAPLAGGLHSLRVTVLTREVGELVVEAEDRLNE